jgi:hypothetical protein
LLGFGNIGCEKPHHGTIDILFDFGGRRGQSGFIARHHQHFRTKRSQFMRGRTAYAGAGTGNQSRLAIETPALKH